MSYETVIEQVKTLPEQLLSSVSAFIKLLQTEQENVCAVQEVSHNKKAFFELAGKIRLDNSSVTELREASLL